MGAAAPPVRPPAPTGSYTSSVRAAQAARAGAMGTEAATAGAGEAAVAGEAVLGTEAAIGAGAVAGPFIGGAVVGCGAGAAYAHATNAGGEPKPPYPKTPAPEGMTWVLRKQNGEWKWSAEPQQPTSGLLDSVKTNTLRVFPVKNPVPHPRVEPVDEIKKIGDENEENACQCCKQPFPQSDTNACCCPTCLKVKLYCTNPKHGCLCKSVHAKMPNLSRFSCPIIGCTYPLKSPCS